MAATTEPFFKNLWRLADTHWRHFIANMETGMNFGKAMGQSEEPKEKEFFTNRDQTKRSHIQLVRDRWFTILQRYRSTIPEDNGYELRE